MTRPRSLLVLLVLALTAAACGTDTAVSRQTLRYGYAPGDTITYDASGTVKGTMHFEGELEPGVDEGDLALDVAFGARVGYAVTEGDDPTLSVVRITQEITRFDGSVDAMGDTQTMTLDDLDGMLPTVVEITIDEVGTIVGVTIDGEPLPTGGDTLGGLGMLGALGDLGGLGSQLISPHHLGPQFPDGAVGVGDEWTTDASDGPLGLSFDQEVRNRIGAEETIGERSTLRIDTTTSTPAAQLGIAELLSGLLGGLEGSDTEDLGMDPAAMGEFLQAMGIEMLLTISANEGTATTWFDPQDGIVVRHEGTAPFGMAVTVSGIPDTDDVALDLAFTLTETLDLVE